MRGVTPESLAATEALRAALRVALAEDAPDVPWTVPPGVADADFLKAIKRHRVFPLLARYADRFEFSSDLSAEIAAGDKAERLNSLRVTQQLIKAHQALTDAGIRALAFKGPVLAQQVYGDFTMRGAGDIDLLVSPDDLEAAYATLEAAGWQGDKTRPGPNDGWAWNHQKRTYYEVSLFGPTMIDLHWHLVNPRSTLPPFDQLWERREQVTLAGEALTAIHRHDSLRHSCAHAAKDGWTSMRSLADIYVLFCSSPSRAWIRRSFNTAQSSSLAMAIADFGTGTSAAPGSITVLGFSRDRVPSRMRKQQAGHLILGRTTRPPGFGTVRGARYAIRGNRSLRDLTRIVAHVILPPQYATTRGTRPLLFEFAKTLAVRVTKRRSRAPSPDSLGS